MYIIVIQVHLIKKKVIQEESEDGFNLLHIEGPGSWLMDDLAFTMKIILIVLKMVLEEGFLVEQSLTVSGLPTIFFSKGLTR